MSVSDMVADLATEPPAEVTLSGVDLAKDGQRREGLSYTAPGEDGAAVTTGGQQTVERAADRRGKKVKRKRR
jgi:preprotein translocase subunit SecA